MILFSQYEIWFVVGSQHLYGDEVLSEVQSNAHLIERHFQEQADLPIKIRFKGLLTNPDMITNLMKSVNHSTNCIGLITWMHTFSPAKMWINGLKILQKPLLHLHTQFNAEIPWNKIDMNYMNLHQSAHGGREFGFICTRLGIRRKVVVGHWKDIKVINKISVWMRAAAAWWDNQSMRIARFGDNMREVAVTEGNQVSAQMKFGYSVNGFGLAELENCINNISKTEVQSVVSDYLTKYDMAPNLLRGGEKHQSLIEAAKIEAGLRTFLSKGRFSAFTTTFENLGNLKQLPGIAVQRLMSDGFGFGAEGDWKTAALLRTMKVMSSGLPGGTSFMEDYTYHYGSRNQFTIGAHMLEICPSITQEQPRCEVHPLGIGGKSDPVRLVFNGQSGPAINATMIDLGNKFKLLVNKVETQTIVEDLPKLPIARVLWQPLPSLQKATQTWIEEGGGHHVCYSQNLTIEHLKDFSELSRIEMMMISEKK